MLKAETILLKTERDYYLKEYKKKVEELSGSAGLKLELDVLKKRLEIISKWLIFKFIFYIFLFIIIENKTMKTDK